MKNLDDELDALIGREFNKFAIKNGLECNYIPFNFIAKEDNKIIGIIQYLIMVELR